VCHEFDLDAGDGNKKQHSCRYECTSPILGPSEARPVVPHDKLMVTAGCLVLSLWQAGCYSDFYGGSRNLPARTNGRSAARIFAASARSLARSG